MKLAAGCTVFLLFLAGSGADAGWFSKKLPKPIDSPMVRPKLKEGHKPGKVHRHPKSSGSYVADVSSSASARA